MRIRKLHKNGIPQMTSLKELCEMILHPYFLASGRKCRNTSESAVTVPVQPEILAVTSATVNFLQVTKHLTFPDV